MKKQIFAACLLFVVFIAFIDADASRVKAEAISQSQTTVQDTKVVGPTATPGPTQVETLTTSADHIFMPVIFSNRTVAKVFHGERKHRLTISS